MVQNQTLLTDDLKHVWHPCTSMKDFEQFPPLVVQRAEGSYLYTSEGPVIDGISSWWCKPLGHGHPRIKAAIIDQLNQFEHVIGAGTTHPKMAALAKRLAELSGLQHIFFASDGASAVEIAMKLALHATQLKGYQARKSFIALKNSYHGETLGTLNVSDVGIFKAPYPSVGMETHFLQTIPYLQNPQDPLWKNAADHWQSVEHELNQRKDKTCAIVVEPIVQGAGGMLCYSADFLNRLSQWAKKNDIYLIADEIMTGLGRTGEWFASQHANIKPDLMCLSKGLTAGSIPMSCVLVDHEIYQLFYGEINSAFLHSHTFSGNALGVSAALATLEVMEEENICQQAQQLGEVMQKAFFEVADLTGKLSNIRGIGGLIAADLSPSSQARLAFHLRQEALKRGALLRPFGNTLYWLPPLNTSKEMIEQLAEITLHSIEAVYKNER